MMTKPKWWHPLGLVVGVSLGVVLQNQNQNTSAATDFRAYLPQAYNSNHVTSCEANN
jgi:hypothetical protein